MSAPPDLMTLAQQLVAQGKYATVQEAAAAIVSGREQVPGGYTQSVPSPGQRQPGPGAPRPQGVAPAQSPRPQAAPALAPPSRSRRPGVYERPDSGESDQYGPARIMNSNAPGVQSNGDDDPWSIGAFEGGTYDPMTMKVLFDRARAGDGEAAYILRQVGFFDEQNGLVFNSNDGLEQWAKARRLDRRAAAGDPSPWYHDPTNFGEQGFRNEQDARDAYDMAPWNQILGDDEQMSPWRRPQAVGSGPSVPPGAPQGDGLPPGSRRFDGPGRIVYGPEQDAGNGWTRLPGQGWDDDGDGTVDRPLGGNVSTSMGARPAEEALPSAYGMTGRLFGGQNKPGLSNQGSEQQSQLIRGSFQSPQPAPEVPLPNGVSLSVTRQRKDDDLQDGLPWHGFRFR